ncbi:MAG: MiaB/RimO family radical SAM methylthiotransferase, partial [Solobacterium sp.]|nr:MiaB/RimO family radical SAM methylthiotransferase [Solobacterium sp.]
VNAYGKDFIEPYDFADLLEDCAATGIERIRFYTSHPRDYTVRTIDVMARHANIMNALHLPVQSGSSEVLRRMARGYTAESYRALYDEMKQRIPDITFTTDLIVGFPGETEEQFEETLDLVRYCRFDMAYAFVFSPRSGTPAASLDDPVSAEEKKDRLHRLNDLLSSFAADRNRTYLGKTLKVLCEGKSKKSDQVYSGYSEENKLVNFTADHDPTGEIVEVEITGTHSFSLDGRAL